MFLKDEAKNAVARVESAKEKNEKETKKLEGVCEYRYNLCNEISKLASKDFKAFLEVIEFTAGATAGKKAKELEAEISASVGELVVAVKNFDSEVEILTKAYEEASLSTGGMAAGVAAGAGVATLAPAGLMAIATTFGTASTGTAISALSGAAATNAALAWLGGGALAAGGGGMSLGGTFLALTGPIGWSIAAVSLIGGGLFYRSKNKETIEKANSAEKEITRVTGKIVAKRKDLWGKYEITRQLMQSYKEYLDETVTNIYTDGLTDKVYEECMLVKDIAQKLAFYLNERVSLNDLK